jgi:hypothetical protein
MLDPKLTQNWKIISIKKQHLIKKKFELKLVKKNHIEFNKIFNSKIIFYLIIGP